MTATDELGRSPEAERFDLSDQHVAFYETFGFLVLRQLFSPEEIGLLIEGFEEVFATYRAEPLKGNPFHRGRGSEHEDEPRHIIPGFIDKSDKLSWLREDRRMKAIATRLLGADYEYAESDGNLMHCDVLWHLDAFGTQFVREHIKVYFYLDPLQAATGALRVIPGTHFPKGPYANRIRKHLTIDPELVKETYGVDLDQIPSYPLEVEPGDVIVGNFRTVHGSFFGAPGRRLFTVNFGARVPHEAAH